MEDLKIDKGAHDSLEVSEYEKGVSINVEDFGGSMDNPWQSASIDLDRNEVLQLKDWLERWLLGKEFENYTKV